MRDQLVTVATDLLEREGPSAVQARRVTREAGASTKVIYHHFGGMPELLRAVSDRGFERLASALAAVAVTDDPVRDLIRLGLAYRDTARTAPHLYDLMFGLAAPGGHRPARDEPGAGELEADEAGPSRSIPPFPAPSQLAFDHLVGAAGRAVESGRLSHVPPELVAAQLWSMLHGVVSLELAGNLPVADPLVAVLLPLGANLLAGLGDDPAATARSGVEALAEHFPSEGPATAQRPPSTPSRATLPT